MTLTSTAGALSVVTAAVTLIAVNTVILLGLLRRVATATPWRAQLGDREAWELNGVDVAARSVTRARHSGRSTGVVMVDLDYFKAINDRHGHLAGDAVLTAVAESLRLTVRPGDLVGRFGGEEFVVLLDGATRNEAIRIATRIHERIGLIGDRTGSSGDADHVTASVGVAILGEHGLDVDELLAAADSALYQAKAAGRDQIQVAGETPSTTAEVAQRAGHHDS